MRVSDPGRGVVVPADRLLTRGQDGVDVLDDAVGRQAAVGFAAVHAAAGRVEAQADAPGGRDGRAEQVAAVARGTGSGGRNWWLQPLSASQPSPAAAAAYTASSSMRAQRG